MATYYIKIKGKDYDKKLIDLAKKLSSGKGDGRLSLQDSRQILKTVKDSADYSDVEKGTMSYIRDNFKFTAEANSWFRAEIRKWAATKNKPAAKPAPKKVASKKPVVKKTAPKKAVAKKAAPKPAVKKIAQRAVVKKVPPKRPVIKEEKPKAAASRPESEYKKMDTVREEIISRGTLTPEMEKQAKELKKSSNTILIIFLLLALGVLLYLFYPQLNKFFAGDDSSKKITAVEPQKEMPAKPVEDAQKKAEEAVKVEPKPVVKEPAAEKKPAEVKPKVEDLTGYYIVKEKESLISIAERELGNFERWKDIYELNKNEIKDPTIIYTGQKLKMPQK